ncbi:MAG TPA: retroviral-like aspartic protease family protein [Gemmataceae bacterium]
MGNESMGRVLTEATIYNLGDLIEVERGKLGAHEVRKVVVTDALVDTGATTLALPKRTLEQLGLTKLYEKRAMTAAGLQAMNVYGAARLEIMGRIATVDPIEVPDGNPVLIGQIPLEMMDWVVDLQGRRLIGNPAHGGEQVLELL